MGIVSGTCLLTLLLSVSTYADELICTDLFEANRSEGEVEDGTGSAINTYDQSEQNRIRLALREAARGRFRDVLLNPQSDFRNMVLPAAARVYPECQGSQDTITEPCMELIAANYASHVLSDEDGALGPEVVCWDAFQQPEYRSAVSEILGDVDNESGGAALRPRLEQILEGVKNTFEQKLNELVSDPEQRRRMIARIRDIKLQVYCGEYETQRTRIDTILKPDAHYMTNTNTITFCPSMTFNNNSEFFLADVLAHEVGHSIDPCSIAMGRSETSVPYQSSGITQMQNEYPIKGIISCLRGPGSYGATREEQQYPTFCSRDQIPEVVADWLAAEIVPEYISSRYPDLTPEQYRRGYSNLFRGTPAIRAVEPAMSFHIRTDTRLNKIHLTNPTIRRQMGCSPTVQGSSYCAAR